MSKSFILCCTKKVALIPTQILREYFHFGQCLHYGNTGCGFFQMGDTRLERFLPKNQHTQRKLLNLENWCSGELSKIGHRFNNKSDLKIDVIKKCQ